MYNIILPQKLNKAIDDLNLSNIQKNHALQFINYLFYLNHVKSKDFITNLYIDISSKTLRKKFTKDYSKKFLSKLIEQSIIVRNSYYNPQKAYLYKGRTITSGKPFGYKVNDNLMDFEDLVSIPITTKAISAKNDQESDVINDLNMLDFDIDKMLKEIKYFEIKDLIIVNEDIVKLGINVITFNGNGHQQPTEAALLKAKFQNEDLIYFKNEAYICNLDNFIKNKTINYKISQLHTVIKLENKEFYASINNTNYRLDTNLTNLKSSFIKNGYIKLKNEKLVDIDLKNSQPCLLAYILTNLSIVKQNFSNLSAYQFPSCNISQDDLHLFCKYAENGEVYDYISTKLNITRQEAKLSFLKVLFCSPRWTSPIKTKIKSIFPTLIQWIDDFKTVNKNHESLAIMLQKLESEIFIDNIYKYLRNDYIIFTKHDSILCKESERSIIKFKMEQILDAYNLKYKLE